MSRSYGMWVLGVLAVLIVALLVQALPFRVSDDLQMEQNDIYNASNINGTTFWQNGTKVLDTGSLAGLNNTNSSNFWDNLDVPGDLNNKLQLSWLNITGKLINSTDTPWFVIVNGELRVNATTLTSYAANYTVNNSLHIGQAVDMIQLTNQIQLRQENITNAFVIAVDNVSLYMTGLDNESMRVNGTWINTTIGELDTDTRVGALTSYLINTSVAITFNESKLNQTIEELDTDTRVGSLVPYLLNNSVRIDFNETKLNQTVEELDTDTTYSNSTGIILNGTVFSLPRDCSGAEVLKYNVTSGLWECEVDEIGTGVNNATVDERIDLAEPDLNVNQSGFWDNLDVPGDLTNLFTLDWANITNRFITAVNEKWFYMVGSTLTLNGTTLNATIEELDTDTTYDNGTGVELSGTTFQLPTSCGASDVLTWNDTSSFWDCLVPPGSTYSNSTGIVLNGTVFSLPRDCSSAEILKYNVTTNLWECEVDESGTGVNNATVDERIDLAEPDLNVNSSDRWDDLDTPTDITSVGTLTSLTVSGSVNLGLNWTLLQNYPSACPYGTYLTELADSVICTSVSHATAGLNITKNVTVQPNNRYCLDGDCNASVYKNSSNGLVYLG